MQATLYAIALWSAWAAARAPGSPARRHAGRFPSCTVATLAMVGVTSLLQLTVAPGLLPALQRIPNELATGQVWRLVTSLLVQDGGVAGTIFNLAALGFIGIAAEESFSRGRWLATWLGAGIGAQLWGLVVQPSGAGNSVGTFGLAAALAVVAVRHGRGASRGLGAVSLLVGLVLVALTDIHGGAMVIGALLGLLMTTGQRTR